MKSAREKMDMTVAEILADFPDLEADDIVDALRYAAEAVGRAPLR